MVSTYQGAKSSDELRISTQAGQVYRIDTAAFKVKKWFSMKKTIVSACAPSNLMMVLITYTLSASHLVNCLLDPCE